MKILCLNAGSATVKYRIFTRGTLARLAHGQASRIGDQGAVIQHVWPDGSVRRHPLPGADHAGVLRGILTDLAADGTLAAPDDVVVAHRVVHGGDRFTAPVWIDEEVLAAIRELGRLAPLHNEIAATGVEIARAALPAASQLAVFDTAFHASMPAHARGYAIPAVYTERGFRRYGFHGISHAYVAAEAARELDRPLESLRLVTLHLGQGASAAAIDGGISVDTSMGMTPLEGLVMGTRSGDLDPGAVLRLIDETGRSAAGVADLLNHESGLQALAGVADMRDIEARAAAGDHRAEEAVALFCYRVKKYIGAYLAVLGGIDAVVFTGGIGEHSATVRARSCEGLGALGLRIDPEANAAHERTVHAGAVPVLVIPTDEELAMARAAVGLFGNERGTGGAR